MRASLEERLQLLEDERAIRRTLFAYAHALDDGDERLWRSCWTDDAVLRWPGLEPFVGRDAIVAAFRAHTHAPEMFHKHLLVEPLIEVEGDAARVDSYFVRLDAYEDGPGIKSFGRYRDVLSRGDDDSWRICERTCERESSRLPPRRPA